MYDWAIAMNDSFNNKRESLPSNLIQASLNGPSEVIP